MGIPPPPRRPGAAMAAMPEEVQRELQRLEEVEEAAFMKLERVAVLQRMDRTEEHMASIAKVVHQVLTGHVWTGAEVRRVAVGG